jgi:hypothetical protein
LKITIPHVAGDDFVVLAHPLDEKLFYQFPDTSSKLSGGLVSQICMPAPIIFPMSISAAAMTPGGPWSMKPGT